MDCDAVGRSGERAHASSSLYAHVPSVLADQSDGDRRAVHGHAFLGDGLLHSSWLDASFCGIPGRDR